MTVHDWAYVVVRGLNNNENTDENENIFHVYINYYIYLI